MTTAPSIQAQMLAAVNAERAAEGLPALCMNSKLQSAAQGHSNDMATNNIFGHTGSDGSSMANRITAAGANILSPSVTMFGSALAVNPDSTYKRYWTQNFASGSTESCS
ncbi:hypothetical protein BBJ29_001692 [Phytophthora kernoviae]|uniref:SCP domain-containing protein n=1 Tax=Phytophthora kernoviae TaxID=325452 RepID=A0A3F2S201_9STRA|nr:hypothetical protein BBJ29_001692 [Phytophthora kernoviae]RLN68777.1 hypothetical protein BBP00_00000811 [Phytophthora kernoviae]